MEGPLTLRWLNRRHQAAARSSQRSTVFQVMRLARAMAGAFDAKRCDFGKARPAVLESMISCAGCRAERLPAGPAPVSTTLPPCGLAETVADDRSTGGIPRQGAFAVGTAETLHRWTL